MVKATFYIPKEYPNSEPIPQDIFNDIKQFLIIEFGGFTILGEATGQWRNPKTGEVAADDSIVFQVGLEKEKVAILKKFLIEMKEKLKQEEIYFELNKETEIEML
ncbi:MAG: hypothetical protein COB53_04295 [Elusimicrobia bacterium]|nr:MAG: hypothetical protein COB53_04295 [Elusimicrobiota bacterium]